LLVLGVLGAALLPGAGPAIAGKVTKVKSTVTITSGEGAEFKGKVTAGNKKCRAGRKVKLFMEPYSGTEDELVGSATTNGAGNWEMKGSFMAGMYHAQVSASTAARRPSAAWSTCRCRPASERGSLRPEGQARA
jgi:hypothetical protein